MTSVDAYIFRGVRQQGSHDGILGFIFRVMTDFVSGFWYKCESNIHALQRICALFGKERVSTDLKKKKGFSFKQLLC